MKTHPQVSVTSPTGEVQVDAGMAGILPALWTLGIKTRFSCQGGGYPGEFGHAYIMFDDLGSADAFARMFKNRDFRWEANNQQIKGGLNVTVRIPVGQLKNVETRLKRATRK